uniref:(northern house mosquito) hypothetical protein n=1 Tax=Culex pipiens TaxID=7175 RepID=A0A8D8P414_CULPI
MANQELHDPRSTEDLPRARDGNCPRTVPPCLLPVTRTCAPTPTTCTTTRTQPDHRLHCPQLPNPAKPSSSRSATCSKLSPPPCRHHPSKPRPLQPRSSHQRNNPPAGTS